MRLPLTADELRAALHYDPETGQFTRRAASRLPAGSRAGAASHNGYRRLYVNGRSVYEHWAAWLYVTGRAPCATIDHIDGDPSNNRFANLREATQGQNNENRRKPYAHNKLGVLGVSRHGLKFRASLRIKGRTVRIGSFDTPEQAHAAYVAAKRQHHAGCTL